MFNTNIVGSETTLLEYVDSANTIHTQSQIIAEWNLNMFDNIKLVGNYKNRPSQGGFTIANKFVEETVSTANKQYLGFTESDVITDGGYNETGIPITFLSKNQKTNILYSLEDCFQKFRPRSGINKLTMFQGRYISGIENDKNTFIRPRYYIADKDDKFKYWTSFRKESNNAGNDVLAEVASIDIELKEETITGAVAVTASGVTTVTYTVSNTFTEGQQVSITNVTPSAFNLSNVDIVSATSTTVVVKAPSTFTATYTSGGKINGVTGSIKYTYLTGYSNVFSVGEVLSIKDGTVTETNIPVESISDRITVTDSTSTYFKISNKLYADKMWRNIKLDSSYASKIGRVAALYDFTAERGISKIDATNKYIDDAAPFVVYNNHVPANRIVVKMQTNVAKETEEYKTFGNIQDPFVGLENKTVPKVWRVQYLDKQNNWNTAVSLTDPALIGDDGYIEFSYGLLYTTSNYDVSAMNIIFAEEYSSVNSLPVESIPGYTYLVKEGNSVGKYYVWDGVDNENSDGHHPIAGYYSFIPEYGWYVGSETPSSKTAYVKDLTSAPSYTDQNDNIIYREFQYIHGIRLVVDTMNTSDTPFDLIEMSPRLVVDLSDKTKDFSINKSSADLGTDGLPVGRLLASTGSLSLFDYDMAFNIHNKNSILNTYSGDTRNYSIPSNNLQIKIYDVIYDDNGISYHVPLKTMYIDGLPQTNHTERSVSLSLRDLFFLFESSNAPQVLVPNASVSFAVASLLDSIGFSNYIFYREPNEVEAVIPYFFVGPDQNIVQVLEALAISTQSAMFFDEYNNFVVMSRDYMLSSRRASEAGTITIRGSADSEQSGIVKNSRILDGENPVLPANIVDISSENSQSFNDGKIQYSTKYIQKSYGTLQEASLLNSERIWYYQPVLLWEVAPPEQVRPVNDNGGVQSAYSLAAIPLKSDLKNIVPGVNKNTGEIENNIVDLGEAVYWLPRYNGYFYSAGEVIKYDAVRYNIPTMPIINLQATLVSGSRIVNLSYGTTSKMSVGQKIVDNIVGMPIEATISKTSLSSNVATIKITGLNPFVVGENISVSIGNSIYDGQYTITAKTNSSISYAKTHSNIAEAKASGKITATERVVTEADCKFAVGAKVSKIINSTQFEVDLAHTLSGDVQFSAKEASNLFWIRDAEEYSNYFSKMPFGGKMYPTGEVRIFVEPYYNKDGSIDTSKPYYPNTDVPIVRRASMSQVNPYINMAAVARHGRMQFSTPIAYHSAGLKEEWTTDAAKKAFKMNTKLMFAGGTVPNTVVDDLVPVGEVLDKKPYLTGVIRSIGSSRNISEDVLNKNDTSITGTVQASALVMSGPVFGTSEKPIKYVSYVHKNMGTESSYRHFGTRMRIVGELGSSDGTQNPTGAMNFLDVKADTGLKNVTSVAGSSGGLGIMVDPATNRGYYMEVVALTDNSLLAYDSLYTSDNADTEIYNVFFYKIQREKGETRTADAIPIVLWKGKTQITVDDGGFTGQYKMTGEPNAAVNDIAVEYREVKDKKNQIEFYLYINDKFVAKVTDTEALPVTQNIALFVRGSSKCMFENVYAIKSRFDDKGEQRGFDTPPAISEVFGVNSRESLNGSLRKYSMSGLIKDTALSGISFSGVPNYDIYFEEFGSIMRECAMFNIKYDKAYPALYAKLSPTFNAFQGYSVSGFTANAYGAEFMIFNTSDSTIVLDSTSGNYLRIQGVTFTQQSDHDLTVDEYMKKKSDFNSISFGSNGLSAATEAGNTLSQIKDSRITYGKKDFTLAAPYIQSQDSANNMMEWIISKIMKPRKMMGIKIFANSLIQVGDMIKIDYKEKSDPNDATSQNVISDTGSSYVVYHVEYSKSSNGPDMTIYVSEVI
jgi:hypothetical protein